MTDIEDDAALARREHLLAHAVRRAPTGALGNGRKQWVRMSPRRSRDSTSSRDGGG